MKFFHYLVEVFRSNGFSDWKGIVSVEEKEARAISITARFARGNVNLQHGRVLTPRQQEARFKEYIDRIENKKFFFQR